MVFFKDFSMESWGRFSIEVSRGFMKFSRGFQKVFQAFGCSFAFDVPVKAFWGDSDVFEEFFFLEKCL